MKIIEEIIEAATDDTVPLSSILRKCLVVAANLKNDRLKAWSLSELNGYDENDELPAYRVLAVLSKGFFLGPFQGQMNDQPLVAGILEKRHRDWATTSYFRDGIAAYEHLAKVEKEGKGNLRIDWPADLVAYYQEKFVPGWALNRAWQSIPTAAMTGLVDAVRNKLLELALELTEEIGDAEEPLDQIEPDQIDRTVRTIIYGGQNIIAGNVAGDIQQTGTSVVVQGDFNSLVVALREIGVPDDEIAALEEAAQVDGDAGFGENSRAWLVRVLGRTAEFAGNVGGKVATSAITKAVLDYFGLG